MIDNNSSVGAAGFNNRREAGADDSLSINYDSNDLVTAGYGDSLGDSGTGAHVDVSTGIGELNVFGFSADSSGIIYLLNGAGGFTSASQAFAAAASDGSAGRATSTSSAIRR